MWPGVVADPQAAELMDIGLDVPRANPNPNDEVEWEVGLE